MNGSCRLGGRDDLKMTNNSTNVIAGLTRDLPSSPEDNVSHWHDTQIEQEREIPAGWPG